MRFKDRAEAGKLLVRALAKFSGKDVVVLALPRGGVPVACEIAQALHAPMDLLLVRKLGVPDQPELAMGAVMDGNPPVVVRNDNVCRQAWVSGAAFNDVCERELAEIERRRLRYLAGRPAVSVSGRTAIIVDDGIATGATVKAAIKGLRKRSPASIVVAVPVAPPDTVFQLQSLADEVICLEEPWAFAAIGEYYQDFRQLSDDDVIALLADAGMFSEEVETG